MNVSTTQREGERLLEDVVQLVQSTYSETLAVGDERGLARLEQAWHRSRRPWSELAGLRVFAMALGAIALIVGGVSVYRRADLLTYRVVNGSVGSGGFVHPTGVGTTILFSEGSEISLGGEARTRVDSLTTDGGRVVVESGTVHARIVPRKHAHWTVEAGPYTIRVTGTAFKVHWSWTDERLEVSMQRGSVVVTGPLAPSGVTLTAGMEMTANPGTGLAIGGGDTPRAAVPGEPAESEPRTRSGGARSELSGSDVAGAAADEAAGGERGLAAEAPVADDGALDLGRGTGTRARATGRQRSGMGQAGHRGAERRLASSQPASGSRAGEGWDKRLAHGDVQGILADADARGLDELLQTASERDLSALADAARYGHRPALARRALFGVRERFAGSQEARNAAFFLGSLADDAPGAGGPTGALEWYDRYLAESRGGRYAPQALGRKMALTQRLHGADAARPLAAEYLSRFPDGPYAAAARKLSPVN
jgi:hypothetical protein